MQIVPTVSHVLNTLTLASDAAILSWILLLLLSRYIRKLRNIKRNIIEHIAPYSRIFACTVALTAMAGSLFYSEVAQYSPCVLCWYQRILMYPQVLLLGIAIIINDVKGLIYPKALSAAGIILSAYHYYLQVGGPSILPCSAVGFSSECSERFSTAYGYITIPMMSLTAFIAIFILLSLYQIYGNRKTQ